MPTIAGPNTNALRSITGYNVGSPLRVTTTPIPARPVQPIVIEQPQPQLRKLPTPQTNTAGTVKAVPGSSGMSTSQQMAAAQGTMALGTDVNTIAKDEVPAQSAKGEGGRILGETAKYASMGLAFGPWGAAVGAVVGLTVGIVKNNKAKEAYKEQMAENEEKRKANSAQQALNANVNAAQRGLNESRSNITMKSPSTRSALKMAPLKKELSSLQASSSYMRTPASAVKRQEIMRTLSGASPLPIGGTFGTTEEGQKWVTVKGNTTWESQASDKEQFNEKYTQLQNRQEQENIRKSKQAFNKTEEGEPLVAAITKYSDDKESKEYKKAVSSYRTAFSKSQNT